MDNVHELAGKLDDVARSPEKQEGDEEAAGDEDGLIGGDARGRSGLGHSGPRRGI